LHGTVIEQFPAGRVRVGSTLVDVRDNLVEVSNSVQPFFDRFVNLALHYRQQFLFHLTSAVGHKAATTLNERNMLGNHSVQTVKCFLAASVANTGIGQADPCGNGQQ